MKRFAVLLAFALCVLATANVLYGGLTPYPHVVLSGLRKAESKSKAVLLLRYGNETQRFDVKEETQHNYNIYANSDKAILLPSPEFNDDAWADMKFRGDIESASIYLVPSGKMVNKPVPSGTVPSAKNGLLNPKSPIEIITLNNILVIDFDYQVSYKYSARLLDSKGRELAVIKSSFDFTDDTSARIDIPDKAAYYYLEFCDGGERIRKYYYILLKIAPDDVKPKENKELTARLERFKKEGAEIERRVDDYMKRKGITGREQLTDEDALEINRERLRTSDTGSAGKQAMSQMDIISQFMKERGVSNMASLSEKDQEELQRRLAKNVILSMPPEYLELANSYMKQHRIKSYDDLTEKDLEAIGKLVEKKAGSSSGSKAKNKSRTRKSK